MKCEVCLIEPATIDSTASEDEQVQVCQGCYDLYYKWIDTFIASLEEE